MHSQKNIIFPGVAGKPISLDIFYKESNEMKPVIIYAHGFNGFKDWGKFDIIAERFGGQGFVFVKFNFSHNGTSPDNPEEFIDLESFGHNNYSKQLEDLRHVIDWVCDPVNKYHQQINKDQLSLIGHSMGGGIVLLQAAQDIRIKKIITWAGISECKTPWGNWANEKIQEWKDTGVQYYINGRTKQQMPLYYQLYKDYEKNKEKLDIQKAIKSLHIPLLICHGTLDSAVPIEKAHELQSWQPNAKLFTVESDHVFGRSHPWNSDDLPTAMEEVIQANLEFSSSWD